MIFTMTKAICIIPARLESSRFPRKILTSIKGTPMFLHVYERAVDSALFDGVYVATHNAEVIDLCKQSGAAYIETSSSHTCGSSRVFEAAKKLKTEWEVVVNLQADQPFLPESYLASVLKGLRSNHISTIAYRSNDESDENTVKVVLDNNDVGIYFSRCPIPFNVEKGTTMTRICHLGLYAYHRAVVDNYPGNFISPLVQAESLEQLDFIFNGFNIDVEMVDNPIPEVNVPEDIKIAKKLGLL